MTLLQPYLEFGASLEHVCSCFSGLAGFRPTLASEPAGGDALVPVGMFRGWTVAVCEATPGRPLPDYASRRDRCAEREVSASPGIIIFTDAAHSAFIWACRIRCCDGYARYREWNATTRRRQLRTALGLLPEAGSPPGVAPEYDSLVIDRLFETMVPAREREAGTEADRLQLMLERIEHFGDPDQVRMAWRRLRGFSVLHEGCVDGARLLKSGATLELLLVATLERMQSFVNDALLNRERRRPEHLRDLRSLTEATEDRAWNYDRARYVRRMIVHQNLFAVVSTRSAGRAVLRDLLAFAGRAESGIPLIDCNIWRRRDLGIAGLPSAVRGTPQPAADVTRPDEELVLHRKAWEMVRKIRLAGGEGPEVKASACQLARRRALLMKQLRRVADVDTRGGEGDELAFCGVAPLRGFSARIGDRSG